MFFFYKKKKELINFFYSFIIWFRYATIFLYFTDLDESEGGETVFTEAWPVDVPLENRKSIEDVSNNKYSIYIFIKYSFFSFVSYICVFILINLFLFIYRQQ